MLKLQINVAVAKGFKNLKFPRSEKEGAKKYIDLWPIQMSAQISTEGDEKQNLLTTNFDTYTLILQLGKYISAYSSLFDFRGVLSPHLENTVLAQDQEQSYLVSRAPVFEQHPAPSK